MHMDLRIDESIGVEQQKVNPCTAAAFMDSHTCL